MQSVDASVSAQRPPICQEIAHNAPPLVIFLIKHFDCSRWMQCDARSTANQGEAEGVDLCPRLKMSPPICQEIAHNAPPSVIKHIIRKTGAAVVGSTREIIRKSHDHFLLRARFCASAALAALAFSSVALAKTHTILIVPVLGLRSRTS